MPQTRMQYRSDAARGRRSREQASREDPKHIAGGPASSDGMRVPHPDNSWNGSEWRQWDKNHGHMLWMGSLQASFGAKPVNLSVISSCLRFHNVLNVNLVLYEY